MKNLIQTILFFFTIISSTVSFSQVTDLGTPLSWNGKMPDLKKNIKMPFVDVQEQLNIDAQNKANGIKMLRFGFEHSTDISVFSEGEVFYTPNGKKVTRLGINCPNALSINLIFEKFQLSPNTTLYFYNADHSEYIGAYTAKNNNASRMLGTEIIHGAQSIVEVVEPKNEIGISILNIGVVVHGYLNVDDVVAKSLNSSGDCEYDVNCPIGAGWELQRNAVAMMMNGGGFCTGSLVNNTSGAIIPYFLTANHCGTSPGAWVFRFRWESPAGQADCATTAPSVNGPTTMNVNGAVLRANSAASDFCLVELNTPPDPTWTIFYNGWDNSENPVSSAVGIHHPAGDIKKISFENDPLLSAGWGGTPTGSHWRVDFWDKGVTEGGSSGSPLFDQNHRTIGQLHGGNSGCGGADLSDEYGKFSRSWLGEGTNATQLKHWLDPNNTGATVIDGVDPAGSPNNLDANLLGITGAQGTICGVFVTPVISIRNLGTTTLTQATVTYNFNGGANQVYNWTGNLATYQIDYITLPMVALPDGNNVLTATVSNPNSGIDENPANNLVTSNFMIVSNSTDATLTIRPDCYASETSWTIRVQGSNTLIAQGGTYSDNSIPTDIVENRCLPVGCYNFIIKDAYGDGMSNNSSGCSQKKGSFELLDMHGDTLCKLSTSQAAFGDSLLIPFCVTAASLGLPTNNLDDVLEVFPNPTNGDITINISIEGEKSIQVFSASGQMLMEKSTKEMSLIMELSRMESGIYFINIQTNQGNVIKKVIKN